MNANIALWLVQDGATTGAIYALLALALLLVFAVSRVIFVPQGDFISYAALTLATLQLGTLPGTVWLLAGGGVLVTLADAVAALRGGTPGRLPRIVALNLALPLAVVALAAWAAPRQLGTPWLMALTLAIVVPLGPMLYRIAYRPLASASVLVLFIVSMAAHYILTGLALVIFGGEGLRASAISDAKFELGVLRLPAQSLWVVGASLLCMLALWLFFERTLARIDALAGAEPIETRDLLPDDIDLTNGTVLIRDAAGTVIATLKITDADLERWLIDAPVEAEPKPADPAG